MQRLLLKPGQQRPQRQAELGHWLFLLVVVYLLEQLELWRLLCKEWFLQNNIYDQFPNSMTFFLVAWVCPIYSASQEDRDTVGCRLSLGWPANRRTSDINSYPDVERRVSRSPVSILGISKAQRVEGSLEGSLEGCHVLRTGHTQIYIASSPLLGHDHSFTYIPIYTHIIPTAPSGLDKDA